MNPPLFYLRYTTYLLLVVSLSGCGIGYVLKQGSTQFKILSESVPIENLLNNDKIEQNVKEKIELIQSVKDFLKEYGYDTSDVYNTYYDTKGEPIAYLVVASKKDALEPKTWSFLFVGSFSYLGFFNYDDAYEEYKSLHNAGFDVTIATVTAYSTLGWFQDPILSSFTEMDEEDLVELIIHELTHREIYSSSDTDFNENVATYFSQVATEVFISKHFGINSDVYKRYLNKKSDYKLFSMFVEKIMKQLNEFYSLNISYEEKIKRREVIFERIKVDFRNLMREFKTNAYAGFARKKLNNAVILTLSSYVGRQEIFEKVFKLCEGDLKKFVEVLKKAAAKNTFEYLKEYEKSIRS